VLLETLAAINRPPLCGLERKSGLAAAMRANGRRLNPSRRPAPVRGPALALGLARFAALGLVLEIFLVIKLLFSRREFKIRTAVDTF
jgi:hypothetical protein